MKDIASLDDYLARYGKLLAHQAEANLRPLHIPGRDAVALPHLLREPFQAQAHVIAAGAKALRRQRSLLVIGEMGVGKTLIGQGIVHAHAMRVPGRRGYRALVFCPGQLCKKWEREIRETVPGAVVIQLECWTDVLAIYKRHYRLVPDLSKGGRLVRQYAKPLKPMWYVIARDRAKLGARWQAAYVHREQMGEPMLRCPDCFAAIVKADQAGGDQEQDGVPLTVDDLTKRRLKCQRCHSPLYRMNRTLDRYEPAKFIHRKLPGFFEYLVLDEAHEEKSAESAQANALGALHAACKRTLPLTGTLIGGYAEHVRPLLMRVAPSSLVAEGFRWKDQMAFSEVYGRIETRVTSKSGKDGDSNRQSRGSSSKTKCCRPGIMPTLFGRHLMQNAVFLGLEEVAANLPDFKESVEGVAMDAEVGAAYKSIDQALQGAIKTMVARGDRRLLGAMLTTLLSYPDHPFAWNQVGYKDKDGAWVCVCRPPNLDSRTVRPKEQRLLEIVQEKVRSGRQVWVYTTMTGERDVAERLTQMFRRAGLRTETLRATVDLAKREEWIARRGPKCDVIVSHPKLVETGLDLFDKGGAHNFSVLIFYQTGYNLFTLRQASRRSWRIGQGLPCEVHYLFYEATMQARAMALMGKKLSAAQAIEGKFSSDGLVAMSGEEGMEMALARSLAERIDEGSPARAWVKIGCRDQAAGRDMNLDDFSLQMETLAQEAAWLFKEMEGLPAEACGFPQAAA